MNEQNQAQSITVKSWIRHHLGWAVFIVLLGIVFIGMMVGGESSQSKVNESAPVVESTSAFDIPVLIGKDLGELITILGMPNENTEPTALQLQSGTKTWEKSWNKDGYFLMATYEIQTKKVTDLFLGTNTDATFAKFNDTAYILKTGNLDMNDTGYVLEFVKARNDNGYTGAIVKEN